MIKHPRKTLAGLTTIVAASALAVGSGASFTSQTANPTNTFASGDFKQTNSKNGASIVTGANMKPGDVKTGEVTITNTGSIAGDFKLSETNDSNTFTGDNLQLLVEDVTATPKTVYSGKFGELNAPIALGSFAAGAARTYKFTVTFKQTAGNEDFSKNASADYVWDAVQGN